MSVSATKVFSMDEINKNQTMFATKFSEGDEDLKELLLWCWRNNISTNSCCCGHGEAGYISFNIKNNNLDLFIYFYEKFKMLPKYDMYLFADHFEIYLKGTHEQTNFKQVLELLKDFSKVANLEIEGLIKNIVTNNKLCSYVKIYPYKNSLFVFWSKSYNLNITPCKDIIKDFGFINE